MQTLSDPEVIDKIKKDFFGATTIIRKTILEGGLVVVDDDDSGSVTPQNPIGLDWHPKPRSPGRTRSNTLEATNEQLNITVVNQSTTSMEVEKVDLVSLGEWKNYSFEGFNNSDEALKKLTKLINNYLEWIVDGMLKHHTGRFCQQQSKVSQTEECLINIIKDFSIPAGLPWHLVEEVYIPINYGDEFHWVLAVIVLKERRIRVYDSMMGRIHSAPSLEIQKLSKILLTYLDISGFLDQKVHTNWSTIEAYWDKMGNLFDIEYVERIDQQPIGSR
ncbi:hypothetical protein CQW23_26330 [Capsicum baccatum]|uniref:Ubiquitin-like protease family profile domain-containing protein n=1 Tax=Capsicum baccatum TaxID=33114 RepID=A0A2G2VNH9_CAPBA|nr:hypothetical protein CQW23_26330 [Capsicum baccatum]